MVVVVVQSVGLVGDGFGGGLSVAECEVSNQDKASTKERKDRYNSGPVQHEEVFGEVCELPSKRVVVLRNSFLVVFTHYVSFGSAVLAMRIQFLPIRPQYES